MVSPVSPDSLVIAHVVDSAGLYGAEAVMLQLCREQVQSGHKPVIASIGVPWGGPKAVELRARELGIECMHFDMLPGPDVVATLRMLGVLRKRGCSILHSHGYKPNILLGFLPSRMRPAPLVTTLHGWTWTKALSKLAVYEWLDVRSLTRMDAVVVVNESMCSLPQIASRRLRFLRTIRNGIEPEVPACNWSVDDEPVRAFAAGTQVIGAVGRLSPEKGFDILIRAFASMGDPRLKLIILGEGDERSSLEALCCALGVAPRVLMPGFVKGAHRFMELFSVFAISSHTEGLPITLLEAMRARIPVVSTAVGGIPPVLSHGRAGTLVPRGDSAALAAGLRRALDGGPDIKSMIDCARASLVSEYSSGAMARAYEDVYRECLNRAQYSR